MATDKKISGLTERTSVQSGDLFPIADADEGNNYKVSLDNVGKSFPNLGANVSTFDTSKDAHVGSNGLKVDGGQVQINDNVAPSGSRIFIGHPNSEIGFSLQHGDGAGSTAQDWRLQVNGTRFKLRDQTGAKDLFKVNTSGDFTIINGALSIPDGITAPSATSGEAKIFVDSADGDLKVIFGDGTTKVITADT